MGCWTLWCRTLSRKCPQAERSCGILPGRMLYFSFENDDNHRIRGHVRCHESLAASHLEAVIGKLFPATLRARLVTLELEGRRPSSEMSIGPHVGLSCGYCAGSTVGIRDTARRNVSPEIQRPRTPDVRSEQSRRRSSAVIVSALVGNGPPQKWPTQVGARQRSSSYVTMPTSRINRGL